MSTTPWMGIPPPKPVIYIFAIIFLITGYFLYGILGIAYAIGGVIIFFILSLVIDKLFGEGATDSIILIIFLFCVLIIIIAANSG
tara:strand:- start:257 stop:511 length:255 start_codon:yes stop_codon:yes gene_type:complete